MHFDVDEYSRRVAQAKAKKRATSTRSTSLRRSVMAMNPHVVTLEQALRELSDVASASRWDVAAAAGRALQSALHALVSDDPEMPPHLWLVEEHHTSIARAAA